ncbi:MAG: transporter substrate-binding domain-containing protein [Rhodospirillaceae bacterium]
MKRRLIRGAVAIGLFFALFLTIGPVQADDVVRIGTYRHYPPWTISDEAGHITGFEIDLINDICRRMGAKCEITTVDWEKIYDDINAKKYDVYIGCMTITSERAEKVAFSVPYALTPEYFATTVNNDLTTLLTLNRLDLDNMTAEGKSTLSTLVDALKGKRVGVHVETVYETFAKQYLTGVADVRLYRSEVEQYADMVHEKLDAVLDGGAPLHEFILSKEKEKVADGTTLTLFGPALTGGPFGRGIGAALRREDVALRARFDAAITAAKVDGTLSRLSLNWFGYNAATD